MIPECRSITKTEGVCGGKACIENTRIPVWLIESYLRMGMKEDDLLKSYPTITLWDIRNCIKYSMNNPEEIQRDIEEQSEDSNDTSNTTNNLDHQ